MIKQKSLFIVVVGFAGFGFGSAGVTIGSIFVAVFLLTNIYNNLKSKYDDLLAIGAIVSVAILFSSSLYIFGQIVMPLGHQLIQLISFGLLMLMSLQSKTKTTERHFFGELVAAISISVCACLWSLISQSKLITLLGFGYDNYGHLYIFRNTLITRSGLFGTGVPDEVVGFIGGSPLGAHNLLALVAEIIGIDGKSAEQSLHFYSFFLYSLPLLVVAVGYQVFKSTCNSKPLVIVSTIVFGLVVIFGYPSHIWNSGYFTSNTATLLLIVSTSVAITKRDDVQRFWVLLVMGVAQFMVYPTYAVLAVVPFAAILISGKTEYLSEIWNSTKQNLLYLALLVTFAFSIIYVALEGLLSVYGGGQFLTPGGIAPLPIGTTMFIFGTSFSFAMKSSNQKYKNMSVLITVFGLTSLVTVGMLFAHKKTNIPGEFWTVPYYPAKLVISVLIVLLSIMFFQFLPRMESSRRFRAETLSELLLLVVVALALIAPSFNSWPFSGGFMGTTQGVVKSLRSGTTEVVDGDHVLKSLSYLQNSPLSALYLSDNHESELNTRWINSINLNWNDDNWGNWMKARQLIEEEKYGEAAEVINGRFVLLIDNYSKFRGNPVAFSVFKNICVIDVMRNNTCRG
jgi:hypothetical protein